MSVYLDASAILPLFVDEPSSDLLEAFVQRLAEPIAVSEFAAAEVAAALSRRSRMGTLTQSEAGVCLRDFDAWRASETFDPGVDAEDLRLTSRFVRRFDLALRAPDALHVAVCLRGGHRLATLDQCLAAAAGALGVVVIVPA